MAYSTGGSAAVCGQTGGRKGESALSNQPHFPSLTAEDSQLNSNETAPPMGGLEPCSQLMYVYACMRA